MTEGIRKLFSKVSHTYELTNHILTFGLDILWRKKLARTAREGNGQRWLDICCGTGETAVNLVRSAKKNTLVYGADFCESMVQKAASKKAANKIHFTLTDAAKLPFKNSVFDLITISFATRNINTSQDHLLNCLREFSRVLKQNGRFLNLETTQPQGKGIRYIFHLYAKVVIKPIGYLISGSKAGYAYLAYTIPRFYGADEFADIIRNSGFSNVTYNRLALGITAIHKAIK